MTAKLNAGNTPNALQFVSVRASIFSLPVRSAFDLLMGQYGSQRFDGSKIGDLPVRDERNFLPCEPPAVAALGVFGGQLSTLSVRTEVAKNKHVECVLGTVQLRGTQ
jgi:hypothetical protein